MFGATRCFYFVPLDIGCIILGVITFFTSGVLAAAAIILLIVENRSKVEGFYYIHHYLHLNLTPVSIVILLLFVAITMLLLMMSSVTLVVGIIKTKQNLLMWYFCYGVVLNILYSHGVLLLLIYTHWSIAFTLLSVILIFSHCLVVVNSTYGFMKSGNVSSNFRFIHSVNNDEEHLIDDME